MLKRLLDASSRGTILVVGFLVLVVAAGISYLVVRLVMARRKVVALLAENRKMEEALKRVEEEIELKREEAIQEGALKRAADLRARISYNRAAIDLLEQDRLDFNSTLEGITKWDDLEVVESDS